MRCFLSFFLSLSLPPFLVLFFTRFFSFDSEERGLRILLFFIFFVFPFTYTLFSHPRCRTCNLRTC